MTSLLTFDWLLGFSHMLDLTDIKLKKALILLEQEFPPLMTSLLTLNRALTGCWGSHTCWISQILNSSKTMILLEQDFPPLMTSLLTLNRALTGCWVSHTCWISQILNSSKTMILLEQELSPSHDLSIDL